MYVNIVTIVIYVISCRVSRKHCNYCNIIGNNCVCDYVTNKLFGLLELLVLPTLGLPLSSSWHTSLATWLWSSELGTKPLVSCPLKTRIFFQPVWIRFYYLASRILTCPSQGQVFVGFHDIIGSPATVFRTSPATASARTCSCISSRVAEESLAPVSWGIHAIHSKTSCSQRRSAEYVLICIYIYIHIYIYIDICLYMLNICWYCCCWSSHLILCWYMLIHLMAESETESLPNRLYGIVRN